MVNVFLGIAPNKAMDTVWGPPTPQFANLFLWFIFPFLFALYPWFLSAWKSRCYDSSPLFLNTLLNEKRFQFPQKAYPSLGLKCSIMYTFQVMWNKDRQRYKIYMEKYKKQKKKKKVGGSSSSKTGWSLNNNLLFRHERLKVRKCSPRHSGLLNLLSVKGYNGVNF